jgi:hypothetical protein
VKIEKLSPKTVQNVSDRNEAFTNLQRAHKRIRSANQLIINLRTKFKEFFIRLQATAVFFAIPCLVERGARMVQLKTNTRAPVLSRGSPRDVHRQAHGLIRYTRNQ